METLVTAMVLVTILHSSVALYSSSSPVVSLTSANFDRLVKDGDSIWIIEFYAPWCGHCQQFASEYSKAAQGLKGIVKVGAINCDEESSLASKYGIKGFPTVKIFSGKKEENYQGARTAKGLIDAAMTAIRKKVEDQSGVKSSSGSGGGSSDKSNVIELTDSNFDSKVLKSEDPWLVEFYAPWCGHCKALAPEWKSAADSLKGKVKVAALDATQNPQKASEYGIQGYPTIKFFPAGPKTSSSVEEYGGGRKADEIVRWAEDKVAESLPPPEIVQITSNDILEEGCNEHALCVIAVLPHILDCNADCRNSYLSILKRNGDLFKKNVWGWLWSQAADYMKLEEALDIGGFGYPTMAVVNVKKGKYSLFRGSFSEEGIREFLRDLNYGKGSSAPIRGAKLPKVEKIDPWDGKDGEMPVEEEYPDDEKDEL